MRDQAAELRRLVIQATRLTAPAAEPSPRLVVLNGAKGGVGVTTLAVNLAVALSQQGSRTVVVEADLYRADAAARCGLSHEASVADVLAARRDIHEVLQRGPAGVQIVPGAWAPGTPLACTEAAQKRLIRQMKALGRHCDMVLVDVGSGTSQVVGRFWQAADDVILVTTPDAISVMDCYATMKVFQSQNESTRVHLVVNKATSADSAADVGRRIGHSCHRFLRRDVRLLGHVPLDEEVDEVVKWQIAAIGARRSKGPAVQAFDELAAALIAAAAPASIHYAASA